MSSNKSNKKVAVILSGCGVQDGSEIHESVFLLNALSKHQASVTTFAPNVNQMHVVNHIKGEPNEKESRNVMEESARITRGAIVDITELTELEISNFDCLLVPGGFGVAKNLCNVAVEGPNMTVIPEVERVITSFHSSSKPMGFCCIAPVLPAKVIGNGVQVTLGGIEEEDGKWPYAGMSGVISAVGATHVEKELKEICVDAENKIVTAPAYMCGTAPMHEIEESVVNMTEKILEMA